MISYSLHLVHWPVIVFYSYWKFGALGTIERASLAAVSVVLAAAVRHFLEQPFRTGHSSLSSRAGVVFTGCTASLAAMVGCVFYFTAGLPSRLPPVSAEIAAAVSEYDAAGLRSSDIETADVLLIGDSYADHLGEAVVFAAAKAGLTVARLHLAGCPPLFGLDVEPKEQPERRCIKGQEYWREAALTFPGRYVALAGRWELLAEEPDTYRPYWLYSGRDGFRDALTTTVRQIETSGKRVVLLGQIPPTKYDLSGCFDEAPFLIGDMEARCPRARFEQRIAFSDTVLSGLAGGRVYTWLASKRFCTPTCRITAGGTLLYRNEDHITRATSIYVGATMMDELTQHFMNTSD